MATAMTILAWLTFLLLVGFFFHEELGRQNNPNQAPESRLGGSGAREVVLLRNRAGHYVTTGRINDREVVFLLDTGATGVAVGQQLAVRLGLERGPRITTRTANGLATAYRTILDSVSVGAIEVKNVPATISPGLATDEVLLGMSFLREIEFTQRGGKLVLRQYP
jgi:aspartyl protease family protein